MKELFKAYLSWRTYRRIRKLRKRGNEYLALHAKYAAKAKVQMEIIKNADSISGAFMEIIADNKGRAAYLLEKAENAATEAEILDQEYREMKE